jgi:tol-pal system protein YbgF
VNLRAFLLFVFCAAAGNAQAGLFSDEQAHKQIEQLEARISKLEEADRQHTQILLDLQMQFESRSEELRKLRGQNEELLHNLQDAEKRQKDFYVDLDSRLRRIEMAASQPAISTAAPVDTAAETRDYEAAHNLFKANKQQNSIAAFQDFLKKYPDSALAANAYFWIGVSYSALKDYKNAIANYQTVVVKYPTNQKAPGALMSVATCYQELNDLAATKKALKQVIANYPDSDFAVRAKKRLAQLK